MKTVPLANRFTSQVGCRYPIICGAMYPCSNPELVAAVSAAGGIGIVQPISLTYVHGRDFRAGLREILAKANAPIGLNLLIEKSSSLYLERNRQWMEIALEEGVRFFITALGNPDWVVERCHRAGAIVYHDVTSQQWAAKAISAGVDGLICVNDRAGGHAGSLPPDRLLAELRNTGKPLICAGGIGNGEAVRAAIAIGYEGVQLGTRFIASEECTAHADYKAAIVRARASDVVLTKKLTGVPVSIIRTAAVAKAGIEPGAIMSRLLKGQRTKHFARLYYSIMSLWRLKRSSLQGSAFRDYFQAGKSVETIDRVQPVSAIMAELISGLDR
jgi:nitronate monooxygenase